MHTQRHTSIYTHSHPFQDMHMHKTGSHALIHTYACTNIPTHTPENKCTCIYMYTPLLCSFLMPEHTHPCTCPCTHSHRSQPFPTTNLYMLMCTHAGADICMYSHEFTPIYPCIHSYTGVHPAMQALLGTHTRVCTLAQVHIF